MVGFISKVIGVLVVGTLFAIVMVPQLLMFKSMAG
jgi:tetrahydromethanopterin S-methyltransferase subunit F